MLIIPAAFLTKTVFSLCGPMPLLFSIALAGIVGCVFMFVLSMVFGMIDLGIVFGRKNPKKALKSVAKNA